MTERTATRPKVAIIGAGLGGLVLAHALRQADVQVTLYERDVSEVSREQGYQIGLSDDGVKALDRVMFPKLAEFIESELAGDRLYKFTLTNRNLRTFCVLSHGPHSRSVAVNRWKLRETLAVLGPQLDIQWNKQFARYEEHEDGRVTIHFEDGSTAEADVVVGADGAKSRVRAQRCPSSLSLNDTHVINIGGVSPLPSAEESPRINAILKNTMVRAFGTNGASLLFMPWRVPASNERKVVWAITQSDSEPGTREAASPSSSPETVVNLCVQQAELGGLHPELVSIIKNCDPSKLIRGGRLYTIEASGTDSALAANPLGKTTRVTLLGDAAHAMTTHMGLGANTALQDAVNLADALKQDDWQTALAQYESKMMKRGLSNAKASLFMTRVITLRPWWARTLRHTAFSIVGAMMWIASFVLG